VSFEKIHRLLWAGSYWNRGLPTRVRLGSVVRQLLPLWSAMKLDRCVGRELLSVYSSYICQYCVVRPHSPRASDV
jgi:hypothetical protein